MSTAAVSSIAPRARAWRNHALTWWLPGKEIGVPLALMLCIPCGLGALAMALVFHASAFASIMVAAAPLFIATMLFLPGATLRIARVQRSEALLLLPNRTRRLRIALFGLVAYMLVPLLLISLLMGHPAPLVFGMVFITSMLLGYWKLPFAAEDGQWLFAVFGLMPMALLSQSKKLHLIDASPWPLLITGLIALGSVLWRDWRIRNPGAMTSPFAWQAKIPRTLNRTMLARVGMTLFCIVLYSHAMKEPGSLMIIVLVASTINASGMLRNDLRLRWLNGMDRLELFRSAFGIALRDQLLAGLLLCAGTGLLVLAGWVDASKAAYMLIALVSATPAILVWQLTALAYVRVHEDDSKELHRKMARALPLLMALPLIVGLIFAANLTDDLGTFGVSALAVSAVLTAIGFPFARRKFERIEL